MKSGIGKLLRVRWLAEDLARAALERETLRLREMEGGVREALAEFVDAARSRAAALRTGDQQEFLLSVAECDFARSSGLRLEEGRRRQEIGIPQFKDRFLDTRVERRQVEALDSARQREEARQGLKREQALLDEWFRNQLRSRDARRERTSDSREMGGDGSKR